MGRSYSLRVGYAKRAFGSGGPSPIHVLEVHNNSIRGSSQWYYRSYGTDCRGTERTVGFPRLPFLGRRRYLLCHQNPNIHSTHDQMPTSIESKQSAKAKYELVYFDLGGRALETRLAMKIGKIEFKDTRLSLYESPP
eukprot:1386353-Amorphochlora_amoeboformis.AAC.1